MDKFLSKVNRRVVVMQPDGNGPYPKCAKPYKVHCTDRFTFATYRVLFVSCPCYLLRGGLICTVRIEKRCVSMLFSE